MSDFDAPSTSGGRRRVGDEAIYRQIYTAIVEHHVAPGTKLTEDSLCDVFGVSRTVVRKALARLSHEGLLTVERNRGARVASPTVEEAQSVFQARRLHEVAAIEPISDALSKADLRELRELAANEHLADSSGNKRQVVRLSGEFHVRLLAVTGNALLVEFLRQLVARSSLVIAMYGFAGGSQNSCRGHTPLLDLLERSDVPGARAWMDEHLREIEAALEFNDRTRHVPDLKGVFAAIEAEQGADADRLDI